MSERVPLADLIVSADPGFASGARSEDGVLQIRMNCVSTDGSLDVASGLRVPVPVKVNRLTLEPGDILFNATNSPELVGKTAVFSGWPEPVTFSNHFLRLRTEPRLLVPAYLARWLQFQWRGRVFQGMCTQWVNQASVRRERLLALKIPLPPLPEQRRIAAILDRADTIRRKRQESLKLIDDLVRSTFLEMFGDPVRNERGWEVVKLGEVAEIVTGNTPSRSSRDNFGGALEWIKSDNVGLDGSIVSVAAETLTAKGRAGGRVVGPGAVLVVCIAGSPASIGRAGIADREVAFNQQINALVPGARLDYRYLYALLTARKALVQRLSTDSMKGLVTKRRLQALPIPIPPLDAQRRLGRALDQHIAIRRTCKKAAALAERSHEALSRAAFTGRL